MYILTPLVTFAEAEREVNKLVSEFLRDGKGYKIKVRLRDSKEGGLRMIDINMFNTPYSQMADTREKTGA